MSDAFYATIALVFVTYFSLFAFNTIPSTYCEAWSGCTCAYCDAYIDTAYLRYDNR